MNALKIVPFALLIAGLGGCVGARNTSPVVAGTSVTVTPAQIKAAQIGVRGVLKDPDSAKFGTSYLAAKQPNGDIDICGEVNAKNSYGGYTGSGPFLARIRDGKSIDATTSSGEDARFLLQVCRERGVPI